MSAAVLRSVGPLTHVISRHNHTILPQRLFFRICVSAASDLSCLFVFSFVPAFIVPIFVFDYSPIGNNTLAVTGSSLATSSDSFGSKCARGVSTRGMLRPFAAGADGHFSFHFYGRPLGSGGAMFRTTHSLLRPLPIRYSLHKQGLLSYRM